MSAKRAVRLFRNGRNQAIRIPRDLELPGSEAVLRKEGEALIIVPARRRSLLETLKTQKTLQPLRERLPPVRDRRPEAVDL